MKKRILEILSVSAILVFTLATPSRALLVTVSDSPSLHVVGDTFAVDLTFSGLGGMTAPSISSYDVLIGFDPAILALTNVAFGTALGGPGGSTSSFIPATGSVQLLETSSLTNAVLDGAQPAAFVAATLTFQAANIGIGLKPFLATGGQFSLTDGTNLKLAVKKIAGCKIVKKKAAKKGTTTNGIVSNLSVGCTQVIAVPEPASFFLLLTGLAGLLVLSRSPAARRAGGAIGRRALAFAPRQA